MSRRSTGPGPSRPRQARRPRARDDEGAIGELVVAEARFVAMTAADEQRAVDALAGLLVELVEPPAAGSEDGDTSWSDNDTPTGW